jgi:anti-anti-sigma factor
MSIRKTSRNDLRRPLAPGEEPPPGAQMRRQGPPPFEARAIESNAEMLVRIRCPICADNALECSSGLRTVMASSPALKVVLDMSACPYLDTPGLGVLVEIRKQMTDDGRALWIQAPSRSVTRMLNLTRMMRLFPLRPAQPDPLDGKQVWPPAGES